MAGEHRERLDLLLDTGSFVETGRLVMQQRSDSTASDARFPGDGVVTGHGTIDGRRVLYQEGGLALMRTPDDLMARYTAGGGSMQPGTVMMSGTLNAIGGIRPASRFEMRLEDPATGRAVSHAYDVAELPVIA